MPTLCIVPTSLRATRAARRLCDAEDGLLFGARVLTPSQLVPGLLAAAGEARPLLTPLAERLLAWECARAAGGPFAGLEPAGGLARAAAAAVAELRDAEVSSAALARAARIAEGSSRERLRLASALVGAYEERLGTLDALDRAGALRAAAAALGRGATSEEIADLDLLVVDGFASLGPPAWALLQALVARARRSHVRVPHFPERPDVTAAEPLLRALESLHGAGGGAGIDVVLERLGGRAPRIASALAAVGGGDARRPDGGDGVVTALPGAGADGEAASAAEWVARLLDRGLAPDDVVLLSADPASHAPLLARAFAARGVAIARGRGEPLGLVPAVGVVRAALAAAPRPSRRAVEELLGSTYLRFDAPSRLRDLLDRAGALEGRGDPEAALRDRAAGLGPSAARERRALLRAADAAADLARAIRPLGAAGTARAHAARVRAFVAAAGLRRRAARAEPELARRDLAGLAALDDCGDALAHALAVLGRGEESFQAAAWRGLLDAALDAASVPGADPAAGAVELWPLAEAPGLSSRAAVVLGCARGRFPQAPRADTLLRDDDRLAVNTSLGRAALATSGRRRAEAFHAAYCALAAGREAVAVAWTGPGPEGGGDAPAPLVVELLAAAGEPLRAVPDRAPLAAANSPAAAPGSGAIPPPLLPALRAALPAEWAPTQLETHARCPFRLFLEVACGLREREDPDVDIDPRDEGSLAHAVLERFLAGKIARGEVLRGDAADRAALRAVADAVFARFEREGRVGDGSLWPARRELVVARLERTIDAEAAAADGLLPAAVEHRFGGDAAAIEIPDGEEVVRLRGRVDRIDASPAALRILDYKNSRDAQGAREKARPEAFGVESFQLPAYLLAARRAFPGRRRLEAGYVFLRSSTRSPMFATAADDPLLALDEPARTEARRSGVTPFADAVAGAVRRIRSGQFPIAPRDCRGCGFGAVCRSEGTEEGEA